MVDFENELERLHFDMSHLKCAKCGKVAYVPYITSKKWKDLGVYSYILYVNAYLHYQYGWHILKDSRQSKLCTDCYHGQDEYKSFSKELADKGNEFKTE